MAYIYGMAPREFRSIRIRAFSGWRALVAGGLVLVVFAALAFLTFGLFLLLLPVVIAVGIASLFLPKARRPAFLYRPRRHRGNVIEGECKVISEEKTAQDEKSPSREGEP